jgi:hypothetical protein
MAVDTKGIVVTSESLTISSDEVELLGSELVRLDEK